jgi:predicted NodU family carbamoyl transferase
MIPSTTAKATNRSEKDWVDEMYVYPAMGDEGLSLGACIYKSVELGELTKPFKLDNVFFGISYNNEEILEYRIKLIEYLRFQYQDLSLFKEGKGSNQ